MHFNYNTFHDIINEKELYVACAIIAESNVNFLLYIINEANTKPIQKALQALSNDKFPR